MFNIMLGGSPVVMKQNNVFVLSSFIAIMCYVLRNVYHQVKYITTFTRNCSQITLLGDNVKRVFLSAIVIMTATDDDLMFYVRLKL